PVGGRLQEYLGVAPGLIQAVTAAGEFVMIRALSRPGWPPMHEWAGRACAAVLAAEAAVPLVDAATPKVMTADAALRTLPAAEDARFRLADWMLVFQSAVSGGLWMTTKGLGRFGAPGGRARRPPPALGRAGPHGRCGGPPRSPAPGRPAVRDRAGPPSAGWPVRRESREGDPARAYAPPATAGPAVALRLTFD